MELAKNFMKSRHSTALQNAKTLKSVVTVVKDRFSTSLQKSNTSNLAETFVRKWLENDLKWSENVPKPIQNDPKTIRSAPKTIQKDLKIVHKWFQKHSEHVPPSGYHLQYHLRKGINTTMVRVIEAFMSQCLILNLVFMDSFLAEWR